MGCSASTVPPATVPDAASAEPKVAEPAAATAVEAKDVKEVAADNEVEAVRSAKARRVSAKTRVRDMCDEGWLEIAEAYCACMDRGAEWGSDEADAALKERGGEGFDNARLTFGASPMLPQKAALAASPCAAHVSP